MIKNIRWGRLLPLALVFAVLALLLFLQAASGVLVRSNPAVALQLNPANSAAMSRLAFIELSQSQAAEQTDTQGPAQAQQPSGGQLGTVLGSADLKAAASGVLPLAKKAFSGDPANPRALAIMAMAQTDDAKSRAFLAAALQLNRRSLALQGLALEQHGKDENLPEFVATLDQILRVHPERLEQFGPVLVDALTKDEALSSFAIVLGKESPWHRNFLKSAAADPKAVVNAAKLSRQVPYRDPELDQMVINRLGLTGNIREAEEHLNWIRTRKGGAGPLPDGASTTSSEAANAAWPTRFPPLDWRFSDDRETRAQISRDGKLVELFVRSGSGGALMSRVIPAPSSSSTIRIAHNIEPADQADAIRLQLACDNAAAPFLDQSFQDIGVSAPLAGMPADCGFMTITVRGRAFTGMPAIRGEISSITIQ